MKIYTRCVYAWQPDGSLKLEEEEFFDYEGPVSLCKDSPAAPPAPDYAGAAQAQGQANIATANTQARLNNPNIISPYGTQNVSYGPTFDQAGYDKQLFQYNHVGGPAPTIEQYTNKETPTITQTLNPQSQQIFDAQQAARLGLANLGQQGIGTAQRTLGSPFAFNGPGVQTSLGPQQTPQNAPNLFEFGQAGANVPAGQGMADTPNLFGLGTANRNVATSPVQNNLDLSNVARMPINPGNTGYDAIMSRLNPELAQQRSMEETRLRNQGLVAGGEAYGNARRVLDQSQNDARLQAAAQAVGLDLSANQQGFNQALQSGQFGNQAAGQQFGQNLQAGQFGNQALAQNQQTALAQQQAQNAAQQQQFAQQFGVQGLQNQAIGQNQGAALTQQQAENAARLQAFNQALQGGQFGNTAQAQALQQQLYQRNLPLNEISALMSGSQIQNPQFQAYQGANIGAPPVANAAQQQAQYNQGLYGLNVGNQNAQMSGLASLGAAGLGAYGSYAGLLALSDRRLKSNVKRIGTHPLGIGIYEYDIFGKRDRGVMADEVLTIKPDAVLTHPSGFLMVDYGRL